MNKDEIRNEFVDLEYLIMDITKPFINYPRESQLARVVAEAYGLMHTVRKWKYAVLRYHGEIETLNDVIKHSESLELAKLEIHQARARYGKEIAEIKAKYEVILSVE